MKPFSVARWFVLTLVLCTLMGITAPVRAADAVVGDGTPASCDQTAYNAAVFETNTNGGTVTFNCGAAPHTIFLNSYNYITGSMAIDGGGLITLDGTTSTSFYQVGTSGNLTLRNINFENGYFNGVSPLENFGTMTLSNVDLNRSATSGSALANYGTMVIDNGSFWNNSADGTITTAGGAIRNYSGSLQIRNSIFHANQLGGGTARGGAIAHEGGTMTIESSVFEYNYALDGAGIHVTGPATATITSSLFFNNTGGYGGGIEMSGSGGQVDVVRSTFRENSVSGDGGAIWTLGGDLDIDTVTFDTNISGTSGGAISCYGDNISIINSTLTNNHSEGIGGGLYSTCNTNITNVTFHDNMANLGGGGLYQAGAGFASVQYATFADNIAPFGAGIYNDDSLGAVITIEKSLLANNNTGNCDGTITSNGYNFSSDTNCGAFTQTGDQQGVALPLEPYGNYGGPTHSRPPVAGNPVIDAIPAGSCGFSVDQRGIARPQNGNCDSGAVEIGGAPYRVFMPTIKQG
jgi:predicted outer membrane repeat protein